MEKVKLKLLVVTNRSPVEELMIPPYKSCLKHMVDKVEKVVNGVDEMQFKLILPKSKCISQVEESGQKNKKALLLFFFLTFTMELNL